MARNPASAGRPSRSCRLPERALDPPSGKPHAAETAPASTSGSRSTFLSPSAVLERLRRVQRERTRIDAHALAQPFHRDDRRHIRRFALASPAHADVTGQFPFLAYMLACRLVPAERRQAAEDAILAGARLTEVGARAGVPMWTRNLPPSACIAPCGPLPDGPDFSPAIIGILRQRLAERHDLRGIVRTIALVGRDADAPLALWLAARLPSFGLGTELSRPLRLLILWYLLARTSSCLGRSLIHTRWSSAISLDTAFHAVRNFGRRIELELLVGPRGLDDPWFPREVFQDLEFVPLVCATAIRAEAERNRNCMDLFGPRLVTRRSRLWSIRSADGECLADIEVGACPTRPGVPCIVQIHAPMNQPASPQVTAVAHLWLREQVRRHGLPDMRLRPLPLPDAERWREIVAPLAAAGVLPPWASACPTRDDFHLLDFELSTFAASIPTTGWRFG